MRPLRLAFAVSMCFGSGCAWGQMSTQRTPQCTDERIEELVRTIDVDPDPLHYDRTLSVYKLIELGEQVIPRMLDLILLNGPYDWTTRLHAQTVIYGVIQEKYGWVSGKGWAVPQGEERWNAFWKSMPTFDEDAPLWKRRLTVMIWRTWLAKSKE